MDNIKQYIRTLFDININILLSPESEYDVKLMVSKGSEECYECVRDILKKKINGGCIYGTDGQLIYFSVSKNEIMVVEDIAKIISKKTSIVIDTVIINPYKFSHSIITKKKLFGWF